MLRERQSSKIVVTWWQNGGRTSRVSHFTLGQGLVGSFALPFFFLFSFLFFLPPLFKTTEGVVVLFQIFAWAPK